MIWRSNTIRPFRWRGLFLTPRQPKKYCLKWKLWLVFNMIKHQEFLKFEAVLAHCEKRVPEGSLFAAMEYGFEMQFFDGHNSLSESGHILAEMLMPSAWGWPSAPNSVISCHLPLLLCLERSHACLRIKGRFWGPFNGTRGCLVDGQGICADRQRLDLAPQ